ncbi:MAG: hypothetical protein WCH35_06480 [Comamonadaceae bacterium]
MNRLIKLLLLTAMLLMPLLAAGGWTLQHWIGTEDFRIKAESQVSAALGVTAGIDRMEVVVWPLPAVVLSGIKIQTDPALKLERLELRPSWRALLLGRLELATVWVHGAMLPQAGIDALLVVLAKRNLSAPTAHEAEGAGNTTFQYIPRRTILDKVTWVSVKGTSTVLDADAYLDQRGMPEVVSIKVLKGQWHGAVADLKRQGKDWTLLVNVGGGTVKGAFQLQESPQLGTAFSLAGQLQTKAVEVAALSTAPQAVLSGRLDAVTTLSVHAASIGALADGLQTHSKFTVGQAVLHGVDLAKAVKTVGLSRGGETSFDTFGGQVISRGRTVQLTNLAASSGVLSANGNVTVAPSRALSGRVNVDLAAATLGGAVGVPLLVGGTLDAPEVTLAHGALIGAAIGTAVMPGVGTGVGASVGDKLGHGLKKIFGK